ncbi:aldo/keto reductase [Mucilaginibacter celer]|uniref:aldo/keto reductase n=1 Tax=Mucilaginibacter celer TaxID=2305508 RepID=UPI0013CE447B|nr:aldo/keto reductase [Mucilaginibacter celer]
MVSCKRIVRNQQEAADKRHYPEYPAPTQPGIYQSAINQGISQLILRWALLKPGSAVVLAGVRNAEQAIENALAMKIDLSREEIALINRDIADVKRTVNLVKRRIRRGRKVSPFKIKGHFADRFNRVL